MKKLVSIALLAALCFCSISCGGTGEGVGDDALTGNFTFDLEPSADGDAGRELGLELRIEAGKVQFGLVRIVSEDLTAETTSDVTGYGNDHRFKIVADLGESSIEIVARQYGIGWRAQYTLQEGGNTSQGIVALLLGPETIDFSGIWQGLGHITGGGGKPHTIVFTFEPNGVIFSANGTWDGKPMVGSGSVLGRKVHFEAAFPKAPESLVFYGDVDPNLVSFSGAGMASLPFTFEMERSVEPR